MLDLYLWKKQFNKHHRLLLVFVGIFIFNLMYAQSGIFIVEYKPFGTINKNKIKPEPDIYEYSTGNPLKTVTLTNNTFKLIIPDSLNTQSKIVLSVSNPKYFDAYTINDLGNFYSSKNKVVDLFPLDRDKVIGYDYLQVINRKKRTWLILSTIVSGGVIYWGINRGEKADNLTDNYEKYTNDEIFRSKFSQSRAEALKEINGLRNDRRIFFGIGIGIPIVTITLTPWKWGIYKR